MKILADYLIDEINKYCRNFYTDDYEDLEYRSIIQKIGKYQYIVPEIIYECYTKILSNTDDLKIKNWIEKNPNSVLANMAHYDTAPKPLYSVFSYKNNAYLYKDSNNSISFDKDKTDITKKDYKFLFSVEELYENHFASSIERKPFDCSLIEGVSYDLSKLDSEMVFKDFIYDELNKSKRYYQSDDYLYYFDEKSSKQRIKAINKCLDFISKYDNK